MATSRPLGDVLPPEIANIIVLQVLHDDRTAVILPRQLCVIGAPRNSDGLLAEEMTIASRCSLSRASKTLRALYVPMFIRKVRNMDVEQIIVKVEDFDISAFWIIFHDFMRSHGHDAVKFPYNFHLNFTDDFLRNPSSAPLVSFLNKWSGVAVQRFTHIDYTIRPIAIQYVDNLRALLNEQLSSRIGMLDPEFLHLLEVFKGLYESREIVQQEDREKKMVGYWVRGRFVVKGAHEWEDEDLVDDQGTALLQFG